MPPRSRCCSCQFSRICAGNEEGTSSLAPTICRSIETFRVRVTSHHVPLLFLLLLSSALVRILRRSHRCYRHRGAGTRVSAVCIPCCVPTLPIHPDNTDQLTSSVNKQLSPRCNTGCTLHAPLFIKRAFFPLSTALLRSRSTLLLMQ